MKDFVILNFNFEDFNVLLFLKNEVTQKKKTLCRSKLCETCQNLFVITNI